MIEFNDFKFTNMPPKSIKKEPKFKYSEDQMALAIQVINNCMGVRKACEKYDVLKSTVLDKLKSRTPMKRKMGHDPYLKECKENAIVGWIKRSLRRGFAPYYHDILNTAQNFILKDHDGVRTTPFADGRPGKTWFSVSNYVATYYN